MNRVSSAVVKKKDCSKVKNKTMDLVQIYFTCIYSVAFKFFPPGSGCRRDYECGSESTALNRNCVWVVDDIWFMVRQLVGMLWYNDILGVECEPVFPPPPRLRSAGSSAGALSLPPGQPARGLGPGIPAARCLGPGISLQCAAGYETHNPASGPAMPSFSLISY